MKTRGILITIALFMFLAGFQPDNRKEKKQIKEKEIYELIESGNFRFIANSARSSLGNFDHLGVGYELVFDSLKLKANLPYFGRAYSVPYGGSGGVNFDLTVGKIEKIWNERKKLYAITTKVDDLHDSYIIYLTAGLSGYANLNINFTNRQMISFYGVIEKIQ